MPMRQAAEHIAEIREKVIEQVDVLRQSLTELEAAMLVNGDLDEPVSVHRTGDYERYRIQQEQQQDQQKQERPSD